MEEFILKHRKEILVLLFGLIFAVLINFWGEKVSLPGFVQKVEAQETTTTVVITAIVEAWLDFQATPTQVTLQPPLVMADGTLNIGSSTDIQLSLGTNAPAGWSISIRGQNNGLYSSSRAHLIPTVTGTSTLATGTEAYGANATSTMSGVTIGPYYDYYGTDTVGEISSSTSRTLGSKNSPNSFNPVANLKIKATASQTTPPGNDYSDTVILTATASL